MNKKLATDQNGRSMIEMLGVLAIVGVLSVAGIAGYSKAMGKYKINKAMDQVSTIVANVKTMFANMGTYSALTGTAAQDLGLLPEEMVKGTGINHAFNSSATVLSATSSIAGDSFAITFNDLPKDACVAMLTADWGGSSGFRSVGVGTNLVTPASTGIFGIATTACSDTQANNDVVWTFY